MISISIDQQTFSDMQADLAWHRAELVRLRAALDDLRGQARYMADTIFELETALGAARAARAAFIAVENERQAGGTDAR